MMESLSVALFTRKQVCRLLVPTAALALMAGIGLSAFGARAAQAQAQAQPAKSEPDAAPALEQPTPQAAQPAAAGEARQNAGAVEGGASENSGSQVAADCASLLKLAAGLKAEVDRTTKEELSVTVVQKAGEIEQLAHKVREKKGN